MKRMLAIFALGSVIASSAHAGLFWGSGANVITDFNSDPVPTSFAFDPLEGAFAQLIRILSGEDPFDFVASGSGISVGNEEVVDVMYAGQYDDLIDPGQFPFNSSTILNDGSFDGSYYVRVFDAAQATIGDWNLGTDAPIPTGAQYYFQSSVYDYTHNESEPSFFNFGSGQTLNLIPEPGTMALLAAGLIGVVAIRRKRLAA